INQSHGDRQERASACRYVNIPTETGLSGFRCIEAAALHSLEAAVLFELYVCVTGNAQISKGQPQNNYDRELSREALCGNRAHANGKCSDHGRKDHIKDIKP